MRVAIDARAYHWSGIGRYIRNIVPGLLRDRYDISVVVLVCPADEAAVREMLVEFPTDRWDVQVVEGSYYSWREQVLLRGQLQRVKADLFHFMHFNVPWGFARPYVVTIHDVTRFIFPGQTRQGWWQQVLYEQIFARAVRGAQGVICVSDATAQELTELPITPLPPLVTIPEGVETGFRQSVATEARHKARLLVGDTAPYLLCVGVWMSHKNLRRLVAAFARLAREYPDLQLVLTGKPRPGYVPVPAIAQEYGVAERTVFLGHVPAHLLPALYAEAACLAFPSLYEGFGFPPLEALACGTPVVTSHVSSMPEVLENAAEYVNPESVTSIASGIRRVLASPERAERIVRAGQARVRLFSWERAVAAHNDFYARLS